MYSFNFPDMLSSVTARLLPDKEAVKSNMRLVLMSEQETLFGDPYFGSTLKKSLFEQSNSIVVDLVIDKIYTTLITFIPQIFLTRKSIKITSDRTDLYAHIEYWYRFDNTSDLYVIKLTSSDLV